MSYTSVLVVLGRGLITYLSACLRLCDVFFWIKHVHVAWNIFEK
jgi:hypothetical protein